MDLARLALKQIITMFFIVFLGMFCYRKKIISEENNRGLSTIVLNIINPAVIFMSYQMDFDHRLLYGLFLSILLGALSFLFAILIAEILVRKKNNKDFNIERIALIYSNCGFIGIPLVNVLVGPVGIFYLAAYLSIFNLLLWTHGVLLMSGGSRKDLNLKVLFSPCLIAVFIGVLCFVLQIRLPEVVNNSIDLIAGMNTPLAMMAAGVSIAQTNLVHSLKNLRIYYIAVIKLILIPVILILAFLPFAQIVDRNILMTIFIATACPTGASGTLFAIRYRGNAAYASELFGITTLMSAISIPAVILLFELLI